MSSGTPRSRARASAAPASRPAPASTSALAGDVLPKLAPRGPFDLVFIDADKEGYPDYLAWAADNLRPGGVVLLDNAFLFGSLADAPTGERATQIRAMQSVHEMLARSGKFRGTVLPTGEGLAFGVRI